MAECHPDRKHCAKGLCRPCYASQQPRVHDPVQHRALGLKRRYNLTLEQYDALLDAQGGVCAVCGRVGYSEKMKDQPRSLAVDHDHKTGLVRGLLCFVCNRSVVARHRDGVKLRRAADYIDNPPARGIIGEHAVPKKKRKRRKAKA